MNDFIDYADDHGTTLYREATPADIALFERSRKERNRQAKEFVAKARLDTALMDRLRQSKPDGAEYVKRVFGV